MTLPDLSRPNANYPLLLFQSSIAQSSLSVLRSHIWQVKKIKILLFSLLYPPRTLCNTSALKSDSDVESVKVHDWTGRVPGYYDDPFDIRTAILDIVNKAPAGPLDVVIDSVDTLASDLGSPSQTYQFIQTLLSAVRNRSSPSRLTLHILYPSPLVPLLTSTSLSPSLILLCAHPPVLLTHLASAYLTPPPPASPPEKFWGVFLPVRDRAHESERLVFGPGGEGTGGAAGGELVLEVLVRGGVARRGVQRSLEGWKGGRVVDLTTLNSLKSIWKHKKADEAPPDPTRNVSFNLNLTPTQQQSRSQVPLPYVHEGKVPEKERNSAILYDPDSADDIDDDDPDEDLDI